MGRGVLLSVIFFCVFYVAKAQTSGYENVLPLIPKPVSVKISEGNFSLSSRTVIVAGDSNSLADAEVFNIELEKLVGFKLAVLPPGKHSNGFGNINLYRSRNKNILKDGYELIINKDEISIHGKEAGVFFALQSLLQLIVPGKEKTFSIPCCEIKDKPRYGWRGMHLDVCRHFFSKEFVKKYIDLIALYKMNTFHWHLTDDQGWRIEIKKYPKLTAVGSKRNGSMIGAFNAQQFDTIPYGGYYTQDDVREIIAYAEQRHITIVPEIEMPGHAMAALASYPQYSCTGGPFEVAKAWGSFDDVFCPGNDSTILFLQQVLTEVCDLFPGKYIHVGGDECSKVRWKTCMKCKSLMQRLQLKNENELQSYFISRIGKFLKSKQKQMIGWDEILEGGLPQGAAVMSWRGVEGGIKAARKQHSVVMSPGSHCYFDFYQGKPDNEPLAIGGYTTVEKVYSYEPTPAALKFSEQKYILGAQGNVWTEYILTPEQVEYMAVPRMCALAEVLWSPKEAKNYSGFQNRLLNHFSFLDQLGIKYATSIYELKISVKPLPEKNGVYCELSSPFTRGKIVYTTDGSIPEINSTVYTSPIRIQKNCNLKTGYFENEKQKSAILEQEFFISQSTGKKITLEVLPHENYFCNGAESLVDGLKGDLHKRGQNWLGWWGPDMKATIDLGEKKNFSKISMDVYDDEPGWIYLPKSIEVFMSDDGINFTTLRKISREEIKSAHQMVEINVAVQSARYIKVVAENFGIIPDGKQGSGSKSWLFVDEISVE